MNSIIRELQMAFIKNRQITDCFVIASEIIHKWKKDMVGGLLVKLDFEKAYDCVNHSFLFSMLEGMGFGARWIHWIANCVTTLSLSVLMNGSPTEQFGIERGIRQRDPLSPFLFNIIIEALNGILMKAANLHMLKGVVFGLREVNITHLQFADDTIVFIDPSLSSLLTLKRILRCFELVSGLRINFHKSCIVRVGTLNFRNPVVQKVEQRLALWKSKFFSKGGRLVLIKAVLASISTYYISVFKMLVGIANKIEKLQRDFFWGDDLEKKKTNLVNWDMVCRSKKKGGLSIGRMLNKNKGLLSKWVWRFGWETDSLWKMVVCAKYGVNSQQLRWNWCSKTQSSHFVKAIKSLHIQGSSTVICMDKGLHVVIGKGDRASFWSDISWNSVALKDAFPRIFALSLKKTGFVKDFGSWQREVWR
ncbi:hypothetical protein LWI28_026562 [Acer negundo]|uniref:Reverse transcriptase domain-containing protein n=1 Tax=Acer negundo TaxID=4023 RepID=A0AAD5J8J1_ACENE|nr:hypothetical protein LWI28_026562 [Acer negundo]